MLGGYDNVYIIATCIISDFYCIAMLFHITYLISDIYEMSHVMKFY